MWLSARTRMIGLFGCAITLDAATSAGSERRRCRRVIRFAGLMMCQILAGSRNNEYPVVIRFIR